MRQTQKVVMTPFLEFVYIWQQPKPETDRGKIIYKQSKQKGA